MNKNPLLAFLIAVDTGDDPGWTAEASLEELAALADTAGAEEVCNGVDDDCDGLVDDNLAGLGASCASSGLGVCAAGATACELGFGRLPVDHLDLCRHRRAGFQR